MRNLTGLAYAIAGSSLARQTFAPSENSLTTVLYHGFFFGNEAKSHARERLRKQLDWLRHTYNPLTLDQYQQAIAVGDLPPRSLLVTADDAMVDLLEVQDEFREFAVPLTVYVCAGWTAQASALEADGLLARVVTTIEWYAGPVATFQVGSESRVILLGREHRSATIDQLLTSREYYAPHLEEILERVRQTAGAPRASTICSWTELNSLRKRGIQFGSHSVTHIRLAPASDVRLNFEITEAKRLIDRKLGPCSSFAYPFGIDGTCDERTTTALKRAGVTTAFMTNPGFASKDTSYFHLPRFALPERHMTQAEYCGRVRGGGVALRRLKNCLSPKNPSR